MQSEITRIFQERFGTDPDHIVRSPGRVNLIGEHTDYNDGFVLPMTINHATWIALRPRDDNHVIVHSDDFGDSLTFDLSNFDNSGEGWSEYVKGTTWALQSAGYDLRGWEGVMRGDVPIGAGLSSSASLELSIARAFSSVTDMNWQPATFARLAQKAENEWVGVNCGIMDQMISASGKTGHALLIDCRSLDTELVPIPCQTAIVILDTGTRRGLVDSAYNERREQCEQAARHFGVKALRDVDLDTFEKHKNELDNVIRRRAKHVITENARTLHARDAMQADDSSTLGKLMNASHISMRDDFEISGNALNTMVEIAQQQSGCLGARMTGGGFAGCAIALVEKVHTETFVEAVTTQYQHQTQIEPSLYVCSPTDGAEIVY